MKLRSLLSVCLTLLLLACNSNTSKDEDEVRAFITEWNAAHTALEASYLMRYYMDVVTYYKNERTKAQVQADKIRLFQEYPDYKQRILDDQLSITKAAGGFLVSFTKRISYNGQEADFTSFLTLGYRNHKLKILREGVSEDPKHNAAPIFPYSRETKMRMEVNRQLFGDFNGDGLSDFAAVQRPEVLTEDTLFENVKCDGDCTSVITFSHNTLQPITVEGSYHSKLENLKDINDDGADDIGFLDIKPMSETLYIFSPVTGALLTAPIYINTVAHRNLSFIDIFKKTGPKKITVSRSVEVDGVWVLESEVLVLD